MFRSTRLICTIHEVRCKRIVFFCPLVVIDSLVFWLHLRRMSFPCRLIAIYQVIVMCICCYTGSLPRQREADEQFKEHMCEARSVLKQWAEILFTLRREEAGNTLFIYRSDVCSAAVALYWSHTSRGWVYLHTVPGGTSLKLTFHHFSYRFILFRRIQKYLFY